MIKVLRTFFFLLLILLKNTHASDKLKITWLGVAGIKISDEKTTLAFDPVFTKPNLGHWLFNLKFSANEPLVKDKIKEYGLSDVSALFASHSHFDHAVDISFLSQETGAKVYGDSSLKKIMSYEQKAGNLNFEMVEDEKEIIVGEFKIHVFKRDHASILNLFDFLPGEIKNFKGNFYDYRVGDTWCYYIEHPNGNILIDQGSHLFEKNKNFSNKTDIYLVGVANKDSLDGLVETNLKKIKAKLIIPLHFDFFFLASSWLESFRLPFSDLEEIKKRVDETHTTFKIPKLGETITYP